MSRFTSTFTHRQAIAVDNTATGATTPTAATLIVPPDFDAFWDNVNPIAGEDIRIMQADGNNPEVYSLTFVFSTRTCTVVFNLTPDSGNAMCNRWLVWGDDTAVDASGSPVASTLTGLLEQAKPSGTAVQKVSAQPLPAGSTSPVETVTKMSTEVQHLWIDVRTLLDSRNNPFNDSSLYEEVAYVTWDVTQSGGSESALFSVTATTFSEAAVANGGGGAMWVKVEWKAGTVSNSYMGLLTIGTTRSRVLTYPINLKVLAIEESS